MEHIAVCGQMQHLEHGRAFPAFHLAQKGDQGKLIAAHVNLSTLLYAIPIRNGGMWNHADKCHPRMAGTSFHGRKESPLCMFLRQSRRKARLTQTQLVLRLCISVHRTLIHLCPRKDSTCRIAFRPRGLPLRRKIRRQQCRV